MKNKLLISVGLLWMVALSGCSLWDFNNPGQWWSSNYQGYWNVRTLEEVSPSVVSYYNFSVFLAVTSFCPEATSYQVQVSRKEDMSDPVFDETSSSNIFNPTDHTLTEGPWFIRARASSTTSEGPWSESVSFTMDAFEVSGLTPTDQGTVDSLSPLLDWEDVRDYEQYQVRYSTDPTRLNEAPIHTVDQSEFTPTSVFMSGDTVYWQIRGGVNMERYNSGAAYSEWTTPVQFEIIP